MDSDRPEVLLTGATGFFGRSLLAQLTRAGHRVHALVPPESRPSLRALVARLGREDREAAARVEPLVGGMTSPGLGLDAQTLEALAPAVGWIVHAASATEPATDPDVLEDVNVRGTDQLLAFAHRLTGLKMFAHVSSSFVSGDYPGRFYEDWLDVGQTFSNPVARSKFTAESHVRAAARSLPVVVLRPGFLAGEASTGACDEDRGLFPLFAMATRLTGRLPVWLPVLAPEGADRYVPITPNDFASEATLAILSQPSNAGSTFCLVDPRPPTVRDMVDHLSDMVGRPLYRVPVRLLTRIPLLGPGRLLGSGHALTRRFGGSPISLYFLLLRNEYDVANTTQALSGTGVSCPPFESYLKQYFDYFVEYYG
ncbi:MAG: SDR family oxidoreductase [Deltaproteobacteria bacterium]|nr:SDR family oxidoreductase [Deltaproteobacteria bacterium]